MYSDPTPWAGLGIVAVLIGLLIYLGVLALMIWIGYLIMRTAVKNGILRADEERARRGYPPNGIGGPPPTGNYPPAPPRGSGAAPPGAG